MTCLTFPFFLGGNKEVDNSSNEGSEAEKQNKEASNL